MQIHGPTHLHGAQPLNAPHRVTASRAPAETSYTAPTDTVEFSSEANLISQVHNLPEIRSDRVAQLRAEIAAGTYETEDKLDAALDRLLDEIA